MEQDSSVLLLVQLICFSNNSMDMQQREEISSLQKIEQMTLFELMRLPPNVAGRQRIVEGDICWIFGVFCAIEQNVDSVSTATQR